MKPIRFIHAARLLLDHQLQGAGSLPDELRPTVEDATLIAFDRVIDACLAHSVDALLLAGDAFDHRDHSLRGAASLVRGLDRLADENVPVVLTAGVRDPWPTWPEGIRLPANVVQLGYDGDAEFPLSRDGQLLAVIRTPAAPDPLASGETEWLLKLPASASSPFTIVLQHAVPERGLPAEFVRSDAGAGPASDCGAAHYWAIGGGVQRRSVTLEQRLLHDPGPTQGVNPLETGARGCSLVEVSSEGDVRTLFIPTAPVRYEQLGLSVTPETTRDDLLDAMREALATISHYDTDKLWLPTWNVSGSGPLLAALTDREMREELLADLHADPHIAGVRVRTQAVRLHPAAEPQAAVDDDYELMAEFDRRLLDRVTRPGWTLSRCLSESPLAGGPWEVQLDSLVAELDAGEVAHDARRLGMQWFAAQEELSS